MNRFVYVIILIVLALATYIVDFSKIFKKEKNKEDKSVQNEDDLFSSNKTASNENYYNEYDQVEEIKIPQDTYYNEYDTNDISVNLEHQSKNVKLEDSGLNIRSVSELKKQGYVYINELLNKTDEELLQIKGIGQKTILQIRSFKI